MTDRGGSPEMVNDGEVTLINQQWQTRLTAAKQENERLQKELRELEEMNEAQYAKFEGCPHSQQGESLCACSFDRKDDVCGLHAPQLREAKAENERLRKERSGHKPLTVGTTTKYPDMPFDAYEKLRLERDALLVENTQHLEHLAKQREQVQRIKEALVMCEYKMDLHLQGEYPDGRALVSAFGYLRAALYGVRKAL